MSNRTIMAWGEIPVSDLEKSVAFYSKVFGYEMKIDTTGPNPMADLGGQQNVAGAHLYPGKPAPDGGSTIHLAIEGKLEDGLDRVMSAGGEVVSEPIPLPTGRFAYARDLDGNSIGLFEASS